ncbi:hypothetical protein LBMAG49_31120 [Planctomycetota bacterium]|nr:hypothetical protein LBMAG49_31120 [Planctomycetota bacterium]
MQVAECGVVDTRESIGGHAVRAADAELSFGLAFGCTLNEGVSDDYRQPVGWVCGAHVIELPLHRLGVAHRGAGCEYCSDFGWLGVGQRVDAAAAVLGVDVEIRGGGAGCANHGETALSEQLPAEIDPFRAVVIAGDQADRHALFDHEAREHQIEQRDGIFRRRHAIVDITGDQHCVGAQV